VSSVSVVFPVDGPSPSVTVDDHLWDRDGAYPIREMNRRLPYPKLARCGMPYGARTGDSDGGWTPVLERGGDWVARLASCENVLCDRCRGRVMAESRARFEWHFSEHVAAGGELVHIRLSVPHRVSDPLKPMLRGLRAAYRGLVRSAVWRRAGFVDQVRVLHVRWSPRAGFHPHLHVTVLVRPGHELDLEAVLPELQGAWRDRLVRAGFRRVSSRHGLFGRVFGSVLDALYAWRGDDDEPGDDYYEPQKHLDGVHDYSHSYEVDHGVDRDDEDEGSWSPFDIARAAIGGDAHAFRLWEELADALYGHPVVVPSKRLNEVWAVVGESVVAGRVASVVAGLPLVPASLPDPGPEVESVSGEVSEPLVVEPLVPVALVGNRLVGRAVSAGCWHAGLVVGAELGVLAAAEFWSEALACHVLVDVDSRGVPLVWADSIGPPGRCAGGSVAVLCDVRDLEVRSR
jgi:hypothetical protein